MSGGSDQTIKLDEAIVLVDEGDRPLGYCEKLAAHQNGGRLHRAFSIFIFNSKGELLLQRRALSKYHFGGLWTNTCCSHPGKDQDVAAAAAARLQEEFGFSVPLRLAFSFVYRAEDASGSGLTEHEFDHVFIGTFDGNPTPNPGEIGEFQWVDPEALKGDMQKFPERYTPWFKIALERVLGWGIRES